MDEEDKAGLPVARHELTDVRPAFIWGALASLSALLMVCALLVWWLYPESLIDQTLRRPLPLYPSPRLQADPREDLQKFQAQEMRWLNSVGWADSSRTTVHIPIDDAMDKVVREGIPEWPAVPP